RVACEALANAARHAAASVCHVRVAVVDAALLVEVLDDGVGITAGTAEGVGLGSIRRRATELGGSVCLTEPAGGGTRLVVRVPLRNRVREPAR
ncbi:MAG TPA: ATP-binding protein, partial [Actinomycetospora sp.]|nr:ATP-binding protein [Actinomycetospora sp.]